MLVRSNYKLLQALSAVFLFCYLLNVVSIEGLHQAIHEHDHSELHSLEAETDACHRAIYHGETSQNCEHKSHVSEQSEDCSLCDVALSNSHFAVSLTSCELEPLPADYQSFVVNFLINETEYYKQSRAPPFSV